MPKNILKRFGARIAQLRRDRSLTQEQLSERTGISVPHLSRMENGHSEPCLLNMKKLAEAFRIDLADLLRDLMGDS